MTNLTFASSSPSSSSAEQMTTERTTASDQGLTMNSCDYNFLRAEEEAEGEEWEREEQELNCDQHPPSSSIASSCSCCPVIS